MQFVTQLMVITLAVFTVVIVILSAYGAILPHKLIDLVRGNMSRGIGLWMAVVVRLVFAVLLWFTAPIFEASFIFKVAAVVLFVSAIGHQIAGRTHLKKLIEAMTTWPVWTIRVPCIIGVLLGVFLLRSIANVLGSA